MRGWSFRVCVAANWVQMFLGSFPDDPLIFRPGVFASALLLARVGFEPRAADVANGFNGSIEFLGPHARGGSNSGKGKATSRRCSVRRRSARWGRDAGDVALGRASLSGGAFVLPARMEELRY